MSRLQPTSEPQPLSYWHESRSPLAALLFLVPAVAIYEVAAEASALTEARNGADCWMRSWMLDAGVAYPWLLPILLVVVLGGWQVVGRYHWQCSLDTLAGMFGESLLFAVGLVVLGQSLAALFSQYGLPLCALHLPPKIVLAASYLGAGIYEEFLFRLVLIPALYWAARALLIPRRWALGLSVIVSSVIFAAAHYVSPTGEDLAASWEPLRQVASDSRQWYGFVFRTLAGIVFAALFLLRGFGIVVGAHALYDLLVGVLMTGPE